MNALSGCSRWSRRPGRTSWTGWTGWTGWSRNGDVRPGFQGLIDYVDFPDRVAMVDLSDYQNDDAGNPENDGEVEPAAMDEVLLWFRCGSDRYSPCTSGDQAAPRRRDDCVSTRHPLRVRAEYVGNSGSRSRAGPGAPPRRKRGLDGPPLSLVARATESAVISDLPTRSTLVGHRERTEGARFGSRWARGGPRVRPS